MVLFYALEYSMHAMLERLMTSIHGYERNGFLNIRELTISEKRKDHPCASILISNPCTRQ